MPRKRTEIPTYETEDGRRVTIPENDPPTDDAPTATDLPEITNTLLVAADLARRLREAVQKVHALAEDPYAEILVYDLLEPVAKIATLLHRLATFAKKREVEP